MNAIAARNDVQATTILMQESDATNTALQQAINGIVHVVVQVNPIDIFNIAYDGVSLRLATLNEDQKKPFKALIDARKNR